MQMFGDWFTVERIKTCMVTPAIIHLRSYANKSEEKSVKSLVRKYLCKKSVCTPIYLRLTGRNTVWIFGPNVLES